MGKAVFPKELLCNEINKSNKKWLDEYKKETNLGKGYYDKIKNFFRFRDYQNMPFNTFTKADVERYIGVMVDSNFKAYTINALPGALSGFKKFHIARNPAFFGKDFLSDLPSHYFENENPSDAFALDSNQINLIREYNRQNILNEYVFEIYFQLGIKKKEITICHPNNNDKKSSCFKTVNGTEIKYNAKIAELLERLPKDNELKLTEVIANYYLYKVTDYLRQQKPSAHDKERQLNYSDLIKSHKKYIFKCPYCDEFTENVAKSWVLIKTDLDSDYRLACSQCRGVRHGN